MSSFHTTTGTMDTDVSQATNEQRPSSKTTEPINSRTLPPCARGGVSSTKQPLRRISWFLTWLLNQPLTCRTLIPRKDFSVASIPSLMMHFNGFYCNEPREGEPSPGALRLQGPTKAAGTLSINCFCGNLTGYAYVNIQRLIGGWGVSGERSPPRAPKALGSLCGNSLWSIKIYI